MVKIYDCRCRECLEPTAVFKTHATINGAPHVVCRLADKRDYDGYGWCPNVSCGDNNWYKKWETCPTPSMQLPAARSGGSTSANLAKKRWKCEHGANNVKYFYKCDHCGEMVPSNNN